MDVKLDLPPKFILFLWRLIYVVVLTTTILQNHHINVPQLCVFCFAEDETLMHLFTHCPFARAVWFGSTLSMLATHTANDFKAWLQLHLETFSRSDLDLTIQCKLFIVLLYHIWEARNQVLHRGTMITPSQVISKSHIVIQHHMAAYQSLANAFNSHMHPNHVHHRRPLQITLLSHKNIVHFYIHRNRGMLCAFTLLTCQGSWKRLSIWRNVENREKRHFLFWCIRDFLKNHSCQIGYVNYIIVQKKGHAGWVRNDTKPPLQLQPIIQDIQQLLLTWLVIYFDTSFSSCLTSI